MHTAAVSDNLTNITVPCVSDSVGFLFKNISSRDVAYAM